MRLKVGDDFLDGDESIIAQTFAVNEIGSIETRQGGFSNNFTIPLTSKNREILGFPSDINSSDRSPYQRIDASLLDKGAVIATGYLKYQVTNRSTLQVSFFSDNVNWFTLIKGKSLKDLDLSEWDHTWDSTDIPASFTNTEGYIYPFIDYNAFAAESSGGTVIRTDNENWLPSTFVKTIVEQIYFDIGWKVQGEVMDLLIPKMILPFSNASYDHTTEWVSENTHTDTVNTPVVIDTIGVDLPFVSAGGTIISWPNESAFVQIKLVLQLSGTGSIQVRVRVGGLALFSDFQTISTPIGTEEFTFIFEKDTEGRKLSVTDAAHAVGSSDTIKATAVMVSGTGTVSATSTIEVIPQTEYRFTTEVNLVDALPDIQHTDFLNYLSFIFGAIPQTNLLSKTVTWSFFNTIKNNLSSAEDWSDKIDMSRTREIDFTQLVQNYAQTSVIKYANGQNDQSLVDYESVNNKSFGEGSFILNNEHLEGRKVIFEAPFAPTRNILNPQTEEVIIPRIPHYVRTFNQDTAQVTRTRQATGFRILILEDDLVSIPDLSGNKRDTVSVGGASVPYAWFDKNTIGISSIDNNLNTLAIESSELINIVGTDLKTRFFEDQVSILNSMKYLSAFVRLTEVDISNLDFTKPVYLDQFKSYFYKSKIVNYQGSDQTTEVELVKIS